MGTDRSLTRVAAQLQKSVTLLGRWSSLYTWTKRCDAYDSAISMEVARKQAIERVKELEDMRKMSKVAAQMAMSKVVKRLAEQTKKKQLTIDSIGDLASLANAAIRLQDNAFGTQSDAAMVSGDKSKGDQSEEMPIIRSIVFQVVGADGVQMTSEEIKQVFDRFYDKPGEH